MPIRRAGPRPDSAKLAKTAQQLAKKVAADVQAKAEGVDAANPALQALVVSAVERAVAQDAFVQKGGMSAADVAAFKVEVAGQTAQALEGLALHAVAEKAATGLRHAERIHGQQAQVLAQISADPPGEAPKIAPAQLERELAPLFEQAARDGSLLAHDLWYADALPRTVQGAKSNDLGVDLGGGATARARPFMAPSDVILESGDQGLISTMESLNIAGTQAALLGLVDGLGGTFAEGADGAAHMASAQKLPARFAGDDAAPLSDDARGLLKKLGAEIVSAADAFSRGETPDWKTLPLAHRALQGSHQRWLQLLDYDPGPNQTVPFDQLSAGDQRNTTSSVIAAVFGAMKAGGMLPTELSPGVPHYLARGASAGENVQVRLETIDDQTAVVLRDTRAKGGDWSLQVGDQTCAAREVDGVWTAAVFAAPGATVTAVDGEGAARALEVSKSATHLDAAALHAQAGEQLAQLEAALGKATSKTSGLSKQAAPLLERYARGLVADRGMDGLKELSAKFPRLLKASPLSFLAAEGPKVGFVDQRGVVTVRPVSRDNARALLAEIKSADETLHAQSTGLRQQILARAEGELRTSETYTFKNDVPRSEWWDYLDPLSSWTDDRRAVHEGIYARAMAQATGLNEVIQRPGEKPTVIAMRGNTAVGKTRTLTTVDSLKEGAKFMKENSQAAINPDPIKQEIVALEEKSGVAVNSAQVHEEGSAISWRLMTKLQETAISMIIDRRLGSPNDVADVVSSAEANNKNVELIDVDAPLSFSLMGVLLREPGGADPIVPFDAVAYGFREVREGRLRVVERVMESDAVQRYDLFATLPDGSKQKVAHKKDGELEILDVGLFDACVGPPDDEIEATKNRLIDAALIQEMTGPLPKGFREAAEKALRRYEGSTFGEAIAAHCQAGERA